MKKILALILLNFTILSLAVSPVSAAYDFKQNSGINDVAPIMGYDANSEMTPEYYIGVVLSLIFSAMGLIFLILIIYAGINWMTAQGNTSQVDKAKNTIIKAIVGLIICLSAYGITYFVMNTFQNTAKQVETTAK